MQAPAERSRQGSSEISAIASTGILIALTYVFTAFINIRLPFGGNGGLIHLGNVPLFLGAILFGRKTGAFAGSIGMALFDLLSGWTIWAPFTFVIVGLMGYLVGMVGEKKNGPLWYGLSFLLAAIIKVAGYYIAEGLLYGNWIAPMGSIPGNICQVTVAAILVLPIATAVKAGMARR